MLVVSKTIRKPVSAVICSASVLNKSRDSSVCIALVYGLDDRGSRVRFPAACGNFSLHHRVQKGSGAGPTSLLSNGY
jgi:hypothetical protein